MAQDPAFLMYYKDIVTSCASWDADELGWYVRLLCHQADKPDGLENDLESLAILASVKFSHFDRFKLCWERRLKAKFEANPLGLLVNRRQEEVINKRREYSESQSIKGIIGSLIKKVKSVTTLTTEQTAFIASELENEDLLNKSIKEKLAMLQAVLVALLGNGNAIEIINTIETKNEGTKKSGARKPQRKGVLSEGLTKELQSN